MIPTRYVRLPILVAAVLLLTLTAALPPMAAAAKPRNVDVLGFSLRNAKSSLVEPGSKLTARNCKPRRLIAFVALSKVRRGAGVTWTWRHNGRMVTRYEKPWKHGRKSRVVRLVLSNSLGLPRGAYQLAVRVPGKGTTIGRVTLACGKR